MSTKQFKNQKGKGVRKGWPTIQDSKPVRLSDASKIIIYNPKTGTNYSMEISW